MADAQLFLLRLRVVVPVLGKDEWPTFPWKRSMCPKRRAPRVHGNQFITNCIEEKLRSEQIVPPFRPPHPLYDDVTLR